MQTNKLTNKLTDFLIKIPDQIGTTKSLVIHTAVFALFLSLPLFGFESEKVQIFFTTLLSLEAIYLAIFIQMAVNKSQASIATIQQDIDEISEDIVELGEDIDEISENVDDIAETVDNIEDVVEEEEEAQRVEDSTKI